MRCRIFLFFLRGRGGQYRFLLLLAFLSAGFYGFWRDVEQRESLFIRTSDRLYDLW